MKLNNKKGDKKYTDVERLIQNGIFYIRVELHHKGSATPSSSYKSKLFAFDLFVCGELDTVLEVPGDDLFVLPAPVVGLKPLPGQHRLGLAE